MKKPNTKTVGNVKTTIRIDYMHVMMQRLFKSVPKNVEKKRIHFKEIYGACEIETRGVYQLDVFDLRVLQAILYLSKYYKRRSALNEKPQEADQKLREDLDLEHESIHAATCYVITSIYEISDILGKKWYGRLQSMIMNSLKNMTGLHIFVDDMNSRKVCGFNLFSFSYSRNNREIKVAVNPFLYAAILAKRQYATIDIEEARQLKSDPACLLHSHLCAVINPGDTQKFKSETLIKYIWDVNEASAKHVMLFKLRKRVLPCFKKIGWEIKDEGEYVYVSRKN